MAKEIDFQEIQEARESQRSWIKEEHTKVHHNYIPKIREKERILKAAREKERVTYQGKKYLKS